MNKEILKQKIQEIKIALDEKYDSVESIGLLTHNAGTSLFYFEYANLFNDEDSYDKTSELIDNSVELINKGNFISTFCGGMAGFLWSLEYFKTNDFVDEEILDGFDEINEYIEEQLNEFIKEKDFDFLHGSVGLGFYLLKKSNRKNNYLPLLKKLVNSLQENAEIEDNTAKWLKYNILQKHDEYNLSLSHGMASILIFLCKYYQLAKDEDAKTLIQQTINYYKTVQNKDIEQIGSYFPNSIYENQEYFKGRLSWCYGDMGIAFAFLKASEVLEDTSLKELAYNIFDFNTKKRDLKAEGLYDACLCHGSTSFALIYHRLYIDTKKELYKETRDFWVKTMLEQAQFEDGLAGFKSYNHDEGMLVDFSLLTGIVGVGLTFLSIYADAEPDWDECLLLS